jgi:TRAP transporter TAXI family solute receptor
MLAGWLHLDVSARMSSPTGISKRRCLSFVRVLALAACITASSVQAQVHRVPLSGGADASTLQQFGDGLSSLLSRSLEGVQVPYTASAGSQENLRRLAGDQPPGFAIVYAGDLFRTETAGSEDGTLPGALVVSHLFSVTAHLLTLRDSPLRRTTDLTGRRVAIGPAGSATANAARHYFEANDLWGRFEAVFMPPSQGVAALVEGRVDALWLFEEMPSMTVIQLAGEAPVRALPLTEATGIAALSAAHPYYTVTTMPGDIYPGIGESVPTLRESALWVASAEVPDDIVNQALHALYSESGLAFMSTVSETARELNRDDGLLGVVTPLHPGAESFWREPPPAGAPP